jgi:hypothetical protein
LLGERPRIDALVTRIECGMDLFRHVKALLQLAFITLFKNLP